MTTSGLWERHDIRQHEITLACIQEQRKMTDQEWAELESMVSGCRHIDTYVDVIGNCGFKDGAYFDTVRIVTRCKACGAEIPEPVSDGPGTELGI